MILWLSSISGITLMDRLPHHAWAAALAIGPLAAWLAWSVQRKRLGHFIAAALANAALWILGPALILQVMP